MENAGNTHSFRRSTEGDGRIRMDVRDIATDWLTGCDVEKWQTKNIAAGPDDRWAAMKCDEIYEILWLVSEDFEAHGLAGEGKGGGG